MLEVLVATKIHVGVKIGTEHQPCLARAWVEEPSLVIM